MDDTEIYLAGILLALASILMVKQLRRRQARQRRARLRRKRRLWSREWLLRRELYGDYENLLWELHREDCRGFRTFIRIPREFFEEMVAKITPAVVKKDTRLRKALPVGLKLAVTLRFLATGNSYTSLSFSFRTSKSAISLFVPIVCRALINAYQPEYLRCPTTPDEWNEIASQFSRRWNYHNCGGALDGKHIAIKKPDHAGSQYFNYKKFHSVILLALADAKYRFLYIDVGAEGGAGDAGTWARCSLFRAIERKRIGFPQDTPLPNDDSPVPFHIIADDAFALKTWLMKPYAHQSQVHHERVFNYRLSRARRVVENAFGILQMRWRIFGTPLLLRPKVVRVVAHCACVLHNLLLHHYPVSANLIDREDQDYDLIPGTWRNQENLLHRLVAEQGRNPTGQAKAIRNFLAYYYASEAGSVPWQERLIYPHGRPAHV